MVFEEGWPDTRFEAKRVASAWNPNSHKNQRSTGEVAPADSCLLSRSLLSPSLSTLPQSICRLCSGHEALNLDRMDVGLRVG